jgi:acyl carrier protein
MGVPVRGRLSSEVESVMGFFNNLLPVHLVVQPSLTIGSWLAAIKRELLECFANEDVPFERLATEPELAVHAQRAGLYQSLYSFQDARDRERHWGPLSHAAVLVMQKGATEDLGLWLMEVPSGLEGGINYNADLFDLTTAKLFRQRLVGLLQRLADSPGQTLESLLAQPSNDAMAFSRWAQTHQTVPVAAQSAQQPLPRVGGLSPAQQKLAEMWARLLGVNPDQIFPEDNFFDLGGTSLLVMRAVADAERELGLKIDPQRFVFESLQQLSAGPPEKLSANADIADTPDAAIQKQGMLSRVLGRLGRSR